MRPILLSFLMIAFAASTQAQTPAAAPVAAPVPVAETPTAAVPGTPAAPVATFVTPALPPGTCPLDASQDTDRNAMPYMHLATQAPGEMKALFTECAALEYMRTGKLPFLSSYGMLYVQKDALPAGTTRPQAIAILASAIGLSGSLSTQAQRAAELAVDPTNPSKEARDYTSSYHGILKQSANMLIVGSEQRHVARRKAFMVAVVSAITVVNDKVVTATFYTPLNSTQTFPKVTAAVEAYANSVLLANPN